jgi:hypothetical protein
MLTFKDVSVQEIESLCIPEIEKVVIMLFGLFDITHAF